MRNVLVGAVETTRVVFETLVSLGRAPLALVTLPTSKAFRHSDWVDLRPLAAPADVPVIEAENVNDAGVLNILADLRPDHVLVVGWSQICRQEFLSIPRVGAIGYHPSPLPQNRGRGVIPWTILQRRSDTAGTFFWLDEGVDSGDILAQHRFAVEPNETARSLYDKHLAVLAQLVSSVLPLLLEGNPPRLPQDHVRATYCAKRVPADGLMDWQADAETVWTLVRAVGRPYPGAFTFRREKAISVWDAEYVGPAPYYGLPGQVQAVTKAGALVQCGDGGHILLVTVQPDGGDELPAAEVLRKHERLGIDWLRLVTHGMMGGDK